MPTWRAVRFLSNSFHAPHALFCWRCRSVYNCGSDASRYLPFLFLSHSSVMIDNKPSITRLYFFNMYAAGKYYMQSQRGDSVPGSCGLREETLFEDSAENLK